MSESPSAIVFRGVVKRFGDATALRGVNLDVPHGEIFGFLGPNGAGKTTALRLLMDFIRPTAGAIEVLGYDARRQSVEVRRNVGYLPSDPAMYGDMTAREYLDYITELRGGREDTPYRRALVAHLQLDEDRKIGALSRGNRQKIGLVQALMTRPPVVILDEPTTGLDPLMQDVVADTLQNCVKDGSTVFFSSHLLAEVEQVCTRVAMLRAGQVVDVIDLAARRRLAPRRIRVTFVTAPPPHAFDGIEGLRLVTSKAAEPGRELAFELRGPVDPLLKRIAQFEVADIDTQELTLEEVFLSYYGDGPGSPSGHGRRDE